MRRKDIPKSIQIKDQIWSIKFKRDLGTMDNKELLGLCIFDERAIFLKTGQNQLELCDSFYHELIHAITHEYEFYLDHRHIYKLGEAMAQIYIDNFL